MQATPRPAIVSSVGFASDTDALLDPRVSELVEQVERSRIEASIRDLSSIRSRHSLSQSIAEARDWLQGQLAALGYVPALHEFSLSGRTLQNVVAVVTSANGSGKTLVLGAHYDSVGTSHHDPEAPAPGADDNATGIAVLLEVARLLKGIELLPHLHLVAFSGEEQGLHGSRAYARALRDEGVTPELMFNLDMVGFPDSQRAIRIERDTGMGDGSANPRSQAVAEDMVRNCQTWTTLAPALDRAYDSDYEPFEALGWPIVGLFESGENPNYHKDTDTLDTVDLDYVVQVARLTLATLLRSFAAEETS